MCDACGCDLKPEHTHDSKVIEVHQSLLAANTAMAVKNREHIEKMGAVAINMISSPGSGKTTLLEKTIEALGDTIRIGVIEGDIETDRDAQRIRAKGVPVIQLTTGGACHLDAAQIHKGLHLLEKEEGELNLISFLLRTLVIWFVRLPSILANIIVSFWYLFRKGPINRQNILKHFTVPRFYYH